jgi:hypothetical protein
VAHLGEVLIQQIIFRQLELEAVDVAVGVFGAAAEDGDEPPMAVEDRPQRGVFADRRLGEAAVDDVEELAAIDTAILGARNDPVVIVGERLESSGRREVGDQEKVQVVAALGPTLGIFDRGDVADLGALGRLSTLVPSLAIAGIYWLGVNGVDPGGSVKSVRYRGCSRWCFDFKTKNRTYRIETKNFLITRPSISQFFQTISHCVLSQYNRTTSHCADSPV